MVEIYYDRPVIVYFYNKFTTDLQQTYNKFTTNFGIDLQQTRDRLWNRFMIELSKYIIADL